MSMATRGWASRYFDVIALPNHATHDRYDQQVFGTPPGTWLWLHKLLDSPFASMFGKRHRKILHDPEGVEEIRRQFGNEAALVAAHHICLDSPTKWEIVNGRLVKKKRK